MWGWLPVGVVVLGSTPTPAHQDSGGNHPSTLSPLCPLAPPAQAPHPVRPDPLDAPSQSWEVKSQGGRGMDLLGREGHPYRAKMGTDLDLIRDLHLMNLTLDTVFCHV